MNVKHYIVTRLNAQCFPSRLNLMKMNLDEDWLRARMKLFTQFTHPSIMNQNFTDFEFMVWCHPESPKWFIQELAMLSGVRAVYVDHYSECIDWSADIITTSRVDSDDCLHEDYMQGIKDHLPKFIESEHIRQIHSYTCGYRYEKNAGPFGTMFEARQHRAPFLTLLADIREDKTDALIYQERHMRIMDKFNTHLDHRLHGWVYMTHDDQICGGGQAKHKLVNVGETFKQFGVKL